MNFIDNRSAFDVGKVNAFKKKIENGTITQEELSEWMTGMVGAYNYTDLNRVEEAVSDLASMLVSIPDELREYGAAIGVAWDNFFNQPYDVGNYTDVETKTNWTGTDIPSSSDMGRYLANIVLLREAFYANYPNLPTSMEGLTFEGANAIEKSLSLLLAAYNEFKTQTEQTMARTAAAWFYSGDLYGGEV